MLRRNVTVWAGKAASLATSPPRTLQFVGSLPALLQQPRRIKASPQMPQRGQVSASACPQEARPCPGLSLAWFSLVCFLCHTVQSLGFERGKRGGGGGCAL